MKLSLSPERKLEALSRYMDAWVDMRCGMAQLSLMDDEEILAALLNRGAPINFIMMSAKTFPSFNQYLKRYEPLRSLRQQYPLTPDEAVPPIQG